MDRRTRCNTQYGPLGRTALSFRPVYGSNVICGLRLVFRHAYLLSLQDIKTQTQTQVYLKAVAETLKRYNAVHGQTILKMQ